MNSSTVDSPWLCVKQAASYAGVSPKTLYAAIQRGELRVARIGAGRSIRVSRVWVDQMLYRLAGGAPAFDEPYEPPQMGSQARKVGAA